MKKKLLEGFKKRKKKSASKKKRSRKNRPLSLFLLALGLAALVWAVWPLRYKLEQQRKISDLRERVDILKQENKELKKEVTGLNSDIYIEQLARKDLGLIKPGEEAYVVASSGEKNNDEETSPKPKKKEKTVWGRVTDWFERVAQ